MQIAMKFVRNVEADYMKKRKFQISSNGPIDANEARACNCCGTSRNSEHRRNICFQMIITFLAE